MSKFSSAMRFDVEKFDGRINFDLWQVQVKDMWRQSGHVKSNCPGGVGSAKDSKSSADNVSIVMGNDEFC